MNKEKLNYRKILTSERLPYKDGKYLCKVKGYNNFEYYTFISGKFYTSFEIVEWIEENPNREEELAHLLEQALNLLNDFAYEKSLQERRANITMNAQNLIWEIKNNAPKLLDDDNE